MLDLWWGRCKQNHADNEHFQVLKKMCPPPCLHHARMSEEMGVSRGEILKPATSTSPEPVAGHPGCLQGACFSGQQPRAALSPSRSQNPADAVTRADHANAGHEAAGLPSLPRPVRRRTLLTCFYVLGFLEDPMQVSVSKIIQCLDFVFTN